MHFYLAILLEVNLMFPIVVGIFLTIGFGFLIATVSSFRLIKRRREIKRSLKTKGRVIEIVARYGGVHVHGQIYAPKIAFQTAQNQTVTFTSETATRPCLYEIGDIVEIYYNPDNPAKAELLDNSFETWGYIAFIIIGIGLMFFGFMGAVLSIYFAVN